MNGLLTRACGQTSGQDSLGQSQSAPENTPAACSRGRRRMSSNRFASATSIANWFSCALTESYHFMDDSDFAGVLILAAVVMFPIIVVGMIVEEIWRWRQRVAEDAKRQRDAETCRGERQEEKR